MLSLGILKLAVHDVNFTRIWSGGEMSFDGPYVFENIQSGRSLVKL